MDDTKKPAADGVAEQGAAFDDQTVDRWAIARERLAAHRRGEAGTMSVEEFFDELRRDLAERRARKA